MSQRTTESDHIGDTWTKPGATDMTVTGKFNDWCLLMRFSDDNACSVGVWALVDLAEFGYTKRST